MSPWISLRFLQTQSDERLLTAAREGHERAFEALVQRYRRPLLRYCQRLLLPQAMADDAVQQGLLQAWLALQHGTEVRDARAWLYRVVHNAAVDALRSSGYDHEQLSESLQGATAPHSDLERRIAVRRALAGLAALPQMQRDALMRTAIEGHSHEQVAAALGLSDGSVRGLVYRARATLRASATAITPAPVVAWLAEAGRRTVPLAERLGGSAAGAGNADAGGALVKGGVAVLTAGALVAGTAAVHPQGARPAHHQGPRATAEQRAPGRGGYPGAGAQHQGPGIGQGRPASPSRAHGSGPAGSDGNVARAAVGGRSALFDRATGSVPGTRLAAGAAPAQQPADRGRPAPAGGSPAGDPQTAAKTHSRGSVTETPPGSSGGRSPDSSGTQSVADSSAASGAPTGERSGEQRGMPGSSDWSDGGAGPVMAGSADAGSNDAGSAETGGRDAGSDAVSGDSGSADAGSGAATPGAEGRSGESGPSGPTGYASSGQASARAATTGPSGDAGATPQRDS